MTKKIDVLYTVNSKGSGTASIEVSEVDGVSLLTSIRGYSSDVDFLQVKVDPNDYGIGSIITSFNDFKDMIPIPKDDYLQLSSSFTNQQIVYWCLGEEGSFDTDQSNVIQQLISKKLVF